MAVPHLVCVLAGSGDPIFSASNIDYRFVEGDLFQHTTAGVTTTWTQFVLRVTASVVP